MNFGKTKKAAIIGLKQRDLLLGVLPHMVDSIIQVTLRFLVEPSITTEPLDIRLVEDRRYSSATYTIFGFRNLERSACPDKRTFWEKITLRGFRYVAKHCLLCLRYKIIRSIERNDTRSCTFSFEYSNFFVRVATTFLLFTSITFLLTYFL